VTAVDPGVTARAGLGADLSHVAGRCPTCGGASLFLGDDGHVTCARLDCPAPAAADDLLHGGPPTAEQAPATGQTTWPSGETTWP